MNGTISGPLFSGTVLGGISTSGLDPYGNVVESAVAFGTTSSGNGSFIITQSAIGTSDRLTGTVVSLRVCLELPSSSSSFLSFFPLALQRQSNYGSDLFLSSRSPLSIQPMDLMGKWKMRIEMV